MMDAIMQGTTPSITIEISPDDLQLSSVTALELYVRNGSNMTAYTLDDVVIDTTANTITKEFTVEETTALSPKQNMTVQARLWLDEKVVGIRKLTFGVDDMMGCGSDG